MTVLGQFLPDKMDTLKQTGVKAVGVVVGTAVVSGLVLLAIYLVNYGASVYTTTSLPTAVPPKNP